MLYYRKNGLEIAIDHDQNFLQSKRFHVLTDKLNPEDLYATSDPEAKSRAFLTLGNPISELVFKQSTKVPCSCGDCMCCAARLSGISLPTLGEIL